MKRKELIKLLTKNGCLLKREGASHSLWYNPVNGIIESIPRHTEISENLAKKIIKRLEIK
ncbi:MAG: type II toxin-antitoxin system HicA family toxin [bacterium]